MFAFFPVSVWRDSVHRNFSFRLKFGANAYVFCEIIYTVFGALFPTNACTGIYKNISIHIGLWKEMDMVTVHKM